LTALRSSVSVAICWLTRYKHKRFGAQVKSTLGLDSPSAETEETFGCC